MKGNNYVLNKNISDNIFNMSALWKRMYSKWKDLKGREKQKKMDFATAAMILLKKSKSSKQVKKRR